MIEDTIEGDTPQKQKWLKWHKENPQVYELFDRFTKEAIRKGHTRLSAWLIINRVRWETSLETFGGDFKISNNFIAYYSRLFMEMNPTYKGFFKIYPMKK